MSFVGSGVELTLLVGGGLLAAGTALNYYNTSQTEKAQENNEAQEIQQQEALQKQGNQDAQAMLAKDQANATDTPQKSQLLNAFQTAIKANAPTASGGLNQVGAVSNQYTQDANNAALGISNYANQQGSNLATMEAPSLQRQAWNANLEQYGSQMGAINQQSAADQGIANIKAQGIQANPWLSAIASALTSYGMGSLSSGMLTGGGANAGLGAATTPDYGAMTSPI